MSLVLEAVLREAQRQGMLGARPIPEVIEHARSFVEALEPQPHRVIDVGAGGGVPGLVIAVLRPDLQLTLVDRREKRTDFLHRAVMSLDLGDRCEVWCRDVRDVVRDLRHRAPAMARWDAVVARGFGPPRDMATLALGLVTPGGRIVVSEPPAELGDRWSGDVLESLGLRRVKPSPHGVAVLLPL